MGGLGKTTLAQLVYNDERVKTHFEMRIWVCVSDDFQIRRLVKAIIESIDGSACNISELDPLQQCLQEKLRGRRFLLVLDDVWNEYHDKWDGLKDVLRCGLRGSMVLVTTRIENIARMMATLPIHQLGCLSDDDSWSLFKGRAFVVGREAETSELESIGKEIVKKCGGVPLAIKALGSMMRLKRRRSDWLSVKESEIWDLSEAGILPALSLSYYHLPPHLKQCFAFCSVFPKDHVLEKDKLIQLWMANGFIPLRGQMELHDIGLGIFDELVSRSFFQDVKEDVYNFYNLANVYDKITFKMHDLIHDLAQSIMRSECSFVELDKMQNVPSTVRHLCVVERFPKEFSWNKDIFRVRSLRSCINLLEYGEGIGKYNAFRPNIFKQRYLRVWEFTYFSIEKLPGSISDLKYLRYLDMSGSFIKVLPESTTCLLNLQTLKLDRCQNLHKLPKGMKHLKNLRHLGITRCDSLTRMPEEMGRLTCLQSLSLFIVGKETGYQISEMKALNLRGELCIKELDNVRSSMDAKNANLIGKQNLDSLRLNWQSDDKSNIPEHVEDVFEGLQPHSSLKTLHIKNYEGSKFPTWMKDLLLQKVAKISLKDCGRCSHLPPLGKLPSLKVLKISGMDAVKYIGSEFHGDGIVSFPSLETFKLHHMRNLEEWRTVPGIENFPRLRSLHVFGCPKLVKLPFIPSLTYLIIDGRIELKYVWSVMKCSSIPLFAISGFRDSAVLSDGLLENHEKLEYLTLRNLLHLKSLTNQLDKLSALEQLILINCNELESLPEGLQNLHPLQILELHHCNSLLSFLVNGLQGLSSLRRLWILDCKKLSSLSEGVQYLTALEELRINGCPELYSLPKHIGCLTSLSSLHIDHCSNLMSLPEELQNLPALKWLGIGDCPHLERRCAKESGEDWHMISHIPSININGQLIQSLNC